MDEADRAEQHEQRERDKNIEQITLRKPEKQLVFRDKIVCVDCFDPIPMIRLHHISTAIRCVSCQEVYELKLKQVRGN